MREMREGESELREITKKVRETGNAQKDKERKEAQRKGRGRRHERIANNWESKTVSDKEI